MAIFLVKLASSLEISDYHISHFMHSWGFYLTNPMGKQNLAQCWAPVCGVLTGGHSASGGGWVNSDFISDMTLFAVMWYI